MEIPLNSTNLRIGQGLITIKLENVPEQQTMRYQEVINTLLASGTLSLRNGRAILHFDSDGNLQKVEHEFIKWIKRRP